MRLTKIQLKNFKVYTDLDLSISKQCIAICGRNGSGKSSLLDAVYYLGLTKSFFNPIDIQNIQFGKNFFTLRGEFADGDNLFSVAVQVEEHKQKIIKKDHEQYKRLSEHVGLIPMVMIAPVDLILVNGTSEERRRFIDQMLGQANREYLERLNQYQKILVQRNALLKQFAESFQFDQELLDSFDQQLIPLGEAIYQDRKNMLDEFIPVFQKYYKAVSGNHENVTLNYLSMLSDSSFKKLLSASAQKDKILQRTTVGVHKDDLEFLLDEHTLKRYGSQGQQKTFVLALKIANYQYLLQKTNTSPLFLLDDLFDKLDDERILNLLNVVFNEIKGQILLTDSNARRVAKNLKAVGISHQIVKVEEFAIA